MSAKNAAIERHISQKARESLSQSDFAGEGTSFPIHQTRIKTRAARKGLKPLDSWQNDKEGQEKRMAGTDTTITEQPESISFYAPFVRVSGADGAMDKREVLGKATRGTVIDTYKTIITYEASKKAFSRAKHIPVREMHQPKAVGKGLDWFGDDKEEDITLHSYISRSADGENTWTKVQENILTGYSIKGQNAKYGTIQRNGQSVTAIVDYDLVEVSLVDNPSCPGCDIAIMRADGIEQEVIASDEELAEVFQRDPSTEQTPPPAPPVEQSAEIERAGARLSSESRTGLHAMRDQAMQLCDCEDCQAMMSNESDAEDTNMMERVTGAVERAMGPVYARMNAYLGEFARRQTDTLALADTIQRVVAMVEALPNAQSFDEVRFEIGIVKDQVERIAKTPLPGGPHTGRTASAKTLATDGTPASQQREAESTPEIMRQLAHSGVTLTPQQSAMVVAGNLKRM